MLAASLAKMLDITEFDENQRINKNLNQITPKPIVSYVGREYERKKMDEWLLRNSSLNFNLSKTQDTTTRTKTSKNIPTGRACAGGIALNDRSGIAC